MNLCRHAYRLPDGRTLRCQRQHHPSSSVHWHETAQKPPGGVDWNTGTKHDTITDAAQGRQDGAASSGGL